VAPGVSYRLVGPRGWPNFFRLDQLFDADHYTECKVITDRAEACRGYFEVERVEDDARDDDD
jgi:hypothetical protein